MRILIGCEFSGIVRDAFIARGHAATSCDVLPTERPGPHLQCDIREIIELEWDMLIAFPPCTYLCNSSSKWLYDQRTGRIDQARWADLRKAARFFRELLEAPIPKIALENPVMHGHARNLVGRDYTQLVQPWMFGHAETKATGFWLKGLPKLQPTSDLQPIEAQIHSIGQRPDRWKERSRTLPGIARAMARQWGSADAERNQSSSLRNRVDAERRI